MFIAVLSLLHSKYTLAQQVIGSFPYMEGGYENQTAGALGTVLSATAWSRQNQAGASSTIVATGGRSGPKYATVTNVATVSRGLQSPQIGVAASGPAQNTAYTVQYHVRNAATVNSFQAGATVNGTTNPTYSVAALLAINGTWTKYTQNITTPNVAVATAGIAVIGRSAAGSFDIDDVVVYAGAVDNSAPGSPTAVNVSNPTLSSLDVSWTAPGGGVDGGGYVVVRYAVNPAGTDDPNQNGIYAVGNTFTVTNTGTVRYIGTGTSFTDNVGLAAGSTYYYKVYAVDKAFNYSAEGTANGTTLSGFSFDGVLNEATWGTAVTDSIGGPVSGFGAAFGLNALYCFGDAGDLYFGIAGRHNSAADALIMFIDCKAGGYTDGNFGRTGAPAGIANFNASTTFDAGFTADFCVSIQSDGSGNYTYNLYTLSGTFGSGGGPNNVLAAGNFGTNAITAGGLTNGFEFRLSKATLGYTANQELKCFATIISNGGFLSNLFLSRAGAAEGNYGSGAITFSAATPNPVTIPYQTATTGNWNSSTAWKLGTANPTNVSIYVMNSHNLSVNTSAGPVQHVTVNTGGTMTFTGANTLTVTNGYNFTNNGSLTAGNGKFIFNGSNMITGTQTFYDVDITGGGLHFGTNSTIGNIFSVNGGGFVSAGGAPYYNSSSTLRYNAGTTPYNRGEEWSSLVPGNRGYPNHVQISNNTGFNPGGNAGMNTSWEAAGNLTVDAGSGFYMDYGTDDMNQPVKFLGDINISGALSLSGNAGGDLKIRGNISFLAGHTFTGNNRAFFLTKNGTQTFSSSATFTLPYLVFEPVSGNTTLQLLQNLNINAPAGGNAIVFSGAGDTYDLNGFSTVIGTAGITNTISGTGTFKGSAASNVTIQGDGNFGIINFTTGSQQLQNFTINRINSGKVTLGTALNVSGTLTLTNGLLDVATNNLLCNSPVSVASPSASRMIVADQSGELRFVYGGNGTRVFPIGDDDAPDGAQYTPVTVQTVSGTYAGAYIGTRVTDVKHPANQAPTDFISRYWSLSSSGITGGISYNVSATYDDNDVSGTEALCTEGRWNGTLWTTAGLVTPATNLIDITGINIYSATNDFSAGEPFTPAEIDVSGNSVSIADGDLTPATGDHTDFGSVVWGNNFTRTFTITNLGVATLNLTGLPVVTVSGSTDFSVTTQPASTTLGNGASTTFIVTYTPSSTGTVTADISIASNDADENPYNFRVQGTGTASNLSDVAFNAGSAASTNTNIDYLTYQSATISNTGSGANGSIGVMGFYVRDGGASLSDADNLGTELNAITFSVTNAANIRSARLFNGNTALGSSVAVGGVSPIVFSGLSGALVTAGDNSQLALNLRVTFNSTVTDNQQIQFTVTSVTAGAALSQFATANGGGAVSSVIGDINRIEVTADRLGYVQNTSNSSVSTNMVPAVTIEGKDINNNRDLDFTGTVDVTSSGTLTGAPVSVAAVSGLATFGSLQHSVAGINLQLTASSLPLIGATSNNFNVYNTALGSYRTTSNGVWLGGSPTVTWEQFTGTWGASTQPPANTVNDVYIRHTVTTGASFGNSINLKIENAGIFNCNHASTTATTYIYSGGTLNINASFTMASGGNFEVEDNGNVNINFSYGNPLTSIWQGTEIFHPASNLTFQDWDFANDFMIADNTSISTNTFSGYTACFGHVIIDVGANMAASDDWILLSSGVNLNMAHGDLRFISCSTAGADIRLSTTGTVTSGIGGDFYIDDLYTGANNINMKTSGTLNFTIKGDYLQDAATVRVHAGSAAGASTVLNIDGNIVITPSAVMDFNSTISANATSTINLKGDITITGSGTLTNTNTSSIGILNFTAPGDGLSAATTQSVNIATSAASENRAINFTVNNGAYVQLSGNDLELGNSASVTVNSGGVFDCGFNGATALLVKEVPATATSTTFNLQSGGILKITHANGIDAGTAAEGNVRTDTRTFNNTATYHYIGKTPSQRIGDGVSTASSGKYVIVELDAITTTLLFEGYNGTAYTATGNIGISNSGNGLKIIQGTVVGTTTGDFTGSGNIEMTGGIYQSNVPTATYNIPQLTGTYTMTGGTVELNAASGQTLRGSRDYFSLTFSNAGTKVLSSALPVNSLDGLVIVKDAAILDVSNNEFSGDAGLNMSGTSRFRMSSLNTTLPQLTGINTPYTLTGGTVELYGTNASQTHSLRGTYGSPTINITYFNIDLNALAANVSAGNANVNMQAGFGLAGTMNVNSPVCFKLPNPFTITDAGVGSTFDLKAGATLKYGGTINSAGPGGDLLTDNRILPVTASYGFVGSSSPQTPGTGLPATMVNMYMDKTAAANLVTMPASLNVESELALFNGKLDLNGFDLTLGTTSSNASVSNASASSYVITWDGALNGHVIHRVNNNSAYTFPMGDLTDYTPATVTMTVGNYTNATLTAAVKDGAHPALGTSTNYLSRYWSIEPNGMTNYFYNISYTYSSPGDEVGIAANLWPFKYNINGWIGCTGSGASALMGNGSFTPGTKTFAWNNLWSFSDFTGNGNGTPLPVTLLSFNAQPQHGAVNLNWVTETEINNDFFMVEKSLNADEFETVGIVDGAGNSFHKKSYQMVDTEPYTGKSYYRLKQTDFDGKVSYSEIKVVEFPGNGLTSGAEVRMDQNGQYYLYAQFTENARKVLYVRDIHGKIIAEYHLTFREGNNLLRMEEISNLSAGVYLISLADDQSVSTFKLIK